MDGNEFRDLRIAAGLSVRAAAKHLDVAPSTIQRWESGSRIPSEAAERLQRIAGIPSRLASAHTLGHLTAILSNVIHGYTPQEFVTHVDPGTRAGIGELITRAMRDHPERYAAFEEDIQELLSGLDDYPEYMDPERTAEFWRGYYKRRKELELRSMT